MAWIDSAVLLSVEQAHEPTAEVVEFPIQVKRAKVVHPFVKRMGAILSQACHAVVCGLGQGRGFFFVKMLKSIGAG